MSQHANGTDKWKELKDFLINSGHPPHDGKGNLSFRSEHSTRRHEDAIYKKWLGTQFQSVLDLINPETGNRANMYLSRRPEVLDRFQHLTTYVSLQKTDPIDLGLNQTHDYSPFTLSVARGVTVLSRLYYESKAKTIPTRPSKRPSK